MTNIQKIFLLAFIFFLAAIPVWRFLIVPGLEKVQTNFSVKVAFNSLGNQYDPEKGAFKEELASKSLLDVTVNSMEGNIIVLDSVFEAQTLSGERIYESGRQYEVDTRTGRSISDQEEWVIFPNHVEKKSYTTTYFVRVDPMKLDFVEEDNLLGLPVYHYRGSDTVDASKAFSFEEGVPEERGVTNSAQADLWIEPFSGHIVKMIDAGENTYFDLNTGQELYPRNIYKNIFSDDTVANNVRIAQNEKQTIQLYERWIPILLGLIALAFLIALFASRKVALKRE